MTRPRILNVEYLRHLYVDRKLSVPEIGIMLNRDVSTIWETMLRYDIPRRTRSEANCIAARKWWSDSDNAVQMMRKLNKAHSCISRPQKLLYKIIKAISPEAKLHMYINQNGRARFLDIAIPSQKIDIEFDAPYWHDEEQDAKRDAELMAIGWKIIRIGYDELGRIQDVKPSNVNSFLILMQYINSREVMG